MRFVASNMPQATRQSDIHVLSLSHPLSDLWRGENSNMTDRYWADCVIRDSLLMGGEPGDGLFGRTRITGTKHSS